MNERIRELMEQAKIKCWHNGDGLISDKAFEIVAELIVKECVGRIKLQYQMDESTPEWIYNTLQEDIKEYFGIEE